MPARAGWAVNGPSGVFSVGAPGQDTPNVCGVPPHPFFDDGRLERRVHCVPRQNATPLAHVRRRLPGGFHVSLRHHPGRFQRRAVRREWGRPLSWLHRFLVVDGAPLSVHSAGCVVAPHAILRAAVAQSLERVCSCASLCGGCDTGPQSYESTSKTNLRSDKGGHGVVAEVFVPGPKQPLNAPHGGKLVSVMASSERAEEVSQCRRAALPWGRSWQRKRRGEWGLGLNCYGHSRVGCYSDTALMGCAFGRVPLRCADSSQNLAVAAITYPDAASTVRRGADHERRLLPTRPVHGPGDVQQRGREHAAGPQVREPVVPDSHYTGRVGKGAFCWATRGS